MYFLWFFTFSLGVFMSWKSDLVNDESNRARDHILYSDDSTYTLRINADLKKDFLQLCKEEQYSAAAAIKRYMLRCVKLGYISHDLRSVREKNGFDDEKRRRFSHDDW